MADALTPPTGARIRPQKAWQIRKLTAGLCRDCGHLLFRGGRCWRHYVLRYCARKTLGPQLVWFDYHETEFLRVLRGRYKALAAEGAAGDPEDVIRLFERGSHKVWIGASTRTWTGRKQDRIREVIRHFDAMALKEHERGRKESGGAGRVGDEVSAGEAADHQRPAHAD